MIYTYKQAIEHYKNDYQLKKALEKEEMIKLEKGLYSTEKSMKSIFRIFIKRNDLILTLQSAFHYHGVTDYTPEYTYIATPRNAYPIRNKEIKQIFMSKKYHEIGLKLDQIDGVSIKVYDLERTVIELIRYEKKISFEEYYHVLKNIREKSMELDFNKLISYAKRFKSYKKIINVVQNSIL